MNRGRKIHQYIKFIRKYGKITEEHYRDPEPFYPKGSYFIVFLSDNDLLSACIGNETKYGAYQSLYYEIKRILKLEETNND